MKKILCFLVITALVAYICATPDKKDPKKAEDDTKKKVEKAKGDGEDKVKEDAAKAKKAKKDLKKKLEEAKGDAEGDAKDCEDEAKKEVPHRPRPRHHNTPGFFGGMMKTGERIVDPFAESLDKWSSIF